MKGDATQLAYRQRLREAHRAAPELLLGGPPIAETLTPDEARQRVREQKAAGYDFIKVIGGFDRAGYDALMAEAAVQRIPVAGHVPDSIGLEAALAAHQGSIEHLMGYGEAVARGPQALAEVATRSRAAGSWNCPTPANGASCAPGRAPTSCSSTAIPSPPSRTWRGRRA
jgi:hypothetical protein